MWLVSAGADILSKNDDGYTPLHYLAARGLSTLLRQVAEMREDFDANTTGSKDTSLLHCAAEQGHLEMIRTLIELGAVVDAVDDENESPLHYACLKGNLPAVQMLVEYKAVINARDNEGSTPLFYACSSGNLNLAKWLVSQVRSIYNGFVLSFYKYVIIIFLRVLFCIILIAVEILACTWHVKGLCQFNSVRILLIIRLHDRGYKELAIWLVDAGIDVNSKNINGHSPMDFAISGNHDDVVAALELKIEEAERVAQAQAETVATLHKAATAGNINVVNQILREGLDANVRNINNSAAIHFAAMAGHLEVVKVMIPEVRRNMDINLSSLRTETICRQS